MSMNLSKIAKSKKIKYFLISFVDLFGVLRSKLVPVQAISEMQKNGAGFAGFATWLDMSPADTDMFAIPDPDSLIQLPWKKEVGWLASDLWMNGKPVKASPRIMLKNQIDKLNKINLKMLGLKSNKKIKIFNHKKNIGERNNLNYLLKKSLLRKLYIKYLPKIFCLLQNIHRLTILHSMVSL